MSHLPLSAEPQPERGDRFPSREAALAQRVRSGDSSEPPRIMPTPPSEVYVRQLARAALEVLNGQRAVAQLAARVSASVTRELAERRAIRTEKRTLTRDHRRHNVVPGRAHLSRPAPDVIEASVSLHEAHRTTATAIRLEWEHGGWRATVLTVL